MLLRLLAIARVAERTQAYDLPEALCRRIAEAIEAPSVVTIQSDQFRALRQRLETAWDAGLAKRYPLLHASA